MIGPMSANTTGFGIIVIGDEVLSGKVEDINSTWLIEQLRELGGRVREVAIIPDDLDVIAATVRRFSASFSTVFTTGGIGPTHDDLTMKGVGRAFDRPLVESPELIAAIRGFFGDERVEAYRVMARVPEGTVMEHDGELPFPSTRFDNVWILPGDPKVMRLKFNAVKESFRQNPFHLRRIYTTLEEGDILELLAETEAAVAEVSVGSYPVYGNPDYKVQVTVESKNASAVDEAAGRIRDGLGADSIFKIV